MNDLVSRKEVLNLLCNLHIDNIAVNDKRITSYVRELPGIPAVPLRDIYKLVAGHSNYSGDSILAALTCVAEGKEVKSIKPIETDKSARWEFWEGSISNHDMRIEDATCSRCGYVHPTVRRTFGTREPFEDVVKKLAATCPRCSADMRGTYAEK